MTKTLSFASSIRSASLLNQATYDLKLSSLCCLICNKLANDHLCLYPPMKCVKKRLLNPFEGRNVVGGDIAKPNIGWYLKSCYEGSTYDHIRDVLKMHKGLEGLKVIEWIF